MVGLEDAGAPQIPALAFSLAMLARLGPLLAVELDLAIPALALAEDQIEPKASPEGFLAVELTGLFAAMEGVLVEEMEDVAPCEEKGCAVLVETEVK